MSSTDTIANTDPACMQGGLAVDVPQAMIGLGQVRHTRLRPKHHAFNYRTFFVMLPMRRLQTSNDAVLPINRAGAISFHDVDHGDGRDTGEGGALAWLDELLHNEGITDATGEVWLHCYPRVLGYTFKPVSFWYCHAADNRLRAIVVEVNNTFGERHCYLLDRPQYGVEQRANKVFHVSPFCAVQGDYRFRFMRTADHTVARVDHDDANGPLIETQTHHKSRVTSRPVALPADDLDGDGAHPLASLQALAQACAVFHQAHAS
jgi:DUF1365 family protein